MADWRAESLVDELLPGAVDWKHWVRRYPLATLSLAALGGYLLGRSRGREIVDSVAEQAADTFSENVHHLIDTRR